MTEWLNANAEGIALALILGMIGLLVLLGAAIVERLVEPRHDRKYRNLAANARGRRAMAEDYQ